VEKIKLRKKVRTKKIRQTDRQTEKKRQTDLETEKETDNDGEKPKL